MQCQNNLKQLALACHNYQEAHEHLPVGTVVESAQSAQERLGLHVHLLPFLEQDHLFRKLDVKRGWKDSANAAAVSSHVRTFQCASDPRAPAEVVNFTLYVGVAGLGEDAPTLPRKDRRAGAFGYERKVRLPADISDGTANTLLFVETLRDNGPWAAGGPATVRGLDTEVRPLVGKDGLVGVTHSASEWNFGRVRPVANVALADGSVRRIREQLKPEVLAALATVAGAELVPFDW